MPTTPTEEQQRTAPPLGEPPRAAPPLPRPPRRRTAPPPPPAEPLARRDGVFRRALLTADLVAIPLAIGAGALIGLEVVPATLLLVALCLGLAKALGLYDRDALILRKTTLEEAPRLAALGGFTVLGAWLLESVVLGAPLRQGEAIGFWAVLLVSLLATRTAARIL